MYQFVTENFHSFRNPKALVIHDLVRLYWNFTSIEFLEVLLDPTSNGRVKLSLEPYFLLTPPGDEKKIINSLPCLSSEINDHNRSSSTLNTFLETPPHFDFDDYRLDRSSPEIDQVEFESQIFDHQSSIQIFKDIRTNNDSISIVHHQISLYFTHSVQ